MIDIRFLLMFPQGCNWGTQWSALVCTLNHGGCPSDSSLEEFKLHTSKKVSKMEVEFLGYPNGKFLNDSFVGMFIFENDPSAKLVVQLEACHLPTLELWKNHDCHVGVLRKCLGTNQNHLRCYLLLKCTYEAKLYSTIVHLGSPVNCKPVRIIRSIRIH